MLNLNVLMLAIMWKPPHKNFLLLIWHFYGCLFWSFRLNFEELLTVSYLSTHGFQIRPKKNELMVLLFYPAVRCLISLKVTIGLNIFQGHLQISGLYCGSSLLGSVYYHS